MKSKFIIFSLTMLLSACTQHANKAAAHYNAQLGLFYAQSGQLAQARTNAYRALQYDPHSFEAHHALAYYAQQTKQSELAQQHYLQALKQVPESGVVNKAYAIFLCEQNDYSRAFSYFEKASQDSHYPDPSDVYEKAGVCALKVPNKPLAMAYFTKALQHDPQRVDLLRQIALDN